ncbi:hypothetical protein ACH4SK_35270 [Streptomyces inhibens]|uniref:hypothetical protein n=1 Tax=Streptomyces inhibens TaxID=2293571 RepID=UPI0037B1DCCC
MNEETLLNSVHSLAWPPRQELQCSMRGHGAGHICRMGSAEVTLPPLVETLSGRYGSPRNLATGGFIDPTVTEQRGLPLLRPFGTAVLEMRAWILGGSWIGCGEIDTGEGRRVVLIIATRPAPVADGLPQDTTWLDRLIALTGHRADREYTVDWVAVEARLGCGLPADYKDMVEIFGYGAFDGFIDLAVPGLPSEESDLVGDALRIAGWARTDGYSMWKPYQPFPAPGGLLRWAFTEQADEFFWLTEGPDPDTWPLLACGEEGEWSRFDGSTTEYVYRLLTDRTLPHSVARYVETHWFQSYGD